MPIDDRDDRLEHDDLSDAERAAIEDENDTGDASAPAQAVTPPTAAAAAPADEADSAAQMREAAQALTAAAQALQAQARPAEAPPPPQEAPPPRNYAAELEALNQQYDDGELDVKDLIAKRDEIRDAQIEERLAHKQAAEQRAQLEATWADAYTGFFSGPEAQINAKLASGVLNDGFNRIAVELVRQGHGFNDALVEARRQVFAEIGLPLPQATTAADAIAKATAKRMPTDRPGPTLGDMPSAGSLATGATDGLDNLKIEDLEDQIAKMSPDALEEYLASAEGGLRDSPRGARD